MSPLQRFFYKQDIYLDKCNYILCTECPADFKACNQSNSCYKVVTRNLIWADAAQECQSLHKDAHLLVIDTAQEQKGIAKWLDSVNSQCSCFHSSLLVDCVRLTIGLRSATR